MSLISDLQNPIVPFHQALPEKIMLWRDEAEGTGDIIGRRVVFGAAMATFAIVGLIDITVSIALAILTSPLLLTDYQLYSVIFFHRATSGIRTSLFYITNGQITNILVNSFANSQEELRNYCNETKLKGPLNVFYMRKVASWRDEAEGTADIIARRAVCSIALVAFSLIGFGELIVTGALTILNAPLSVAGNKWANYPRTLATKVVNCALSSLAYLTVEQVRNIGSEKLNNANLK